ncbi:class I SAM-dependent methyltransferase [Methanosarcina sp. MSH10X1]|nr:class I SAM-dependent methyltransferase [Methanosarcina sp. MSH10X1]
MSQYPQWYYDEFKQIGVDYTDLEEAQAYDLRMQALRDTENEANNLRELLGIKNTDRILEIGTGTGELALKLSEHCKKIVAIDVSKTMVEFAKMKAESQNKKSIQFYTAGFLTYEHCTEPFDVIITQLALHHLPDYWKLIALRRVYGMLREGGKFYLLDVVFPSQIRDYDSYFNKIITNLRETAGNELAEETETHIREEFSTLDWIMEGLLKSAGFYIESVNYDGFMAGYLCRK